MSSGSAGRCGWVSSVLCDRGKLRIKVHRDVLVETTKRDVWTVTQVVETIQVLPLFGIS